MSLDEENRVSDWQQNLFKVVSTGSIRIIDMNGDDLQKLHTKPLEIIVFHKSPSGHRK